MKPANAKQAGYTIVEVMIFLAISSVLLLSAIGMFSGRIQRTQFSQSAQALDSQIKSVANESSTGTYPSTPAFNCVVVAGQPVTNPFVSGSQGSRTDCIFAGKIINFGALSGTCTTPMTSASCINLDVYTVVGRRLVPATNQVSTSLTGATGAAPRIVQTPNLTQTINLGYGTRVTSVSLKPSSGPLVPVSGIGFFQSYNGSYNNQGSLASGSQNIQTWYVRSSTPPVAPLNQAQMAVAVRQEAMTHLTAPNTLLICLKSGNNGQNASITIDNSNSAPATTTVIEDVQCP